MHLFRLTAASCKPLLTKVTKYENSVLHIIFFILISLYK